MADIDQMNGIPFLERIGLFPASRNPMPRIEPAALLAHTIPLEAPLPLYELQYHLDGEPEPPDRPVTQEWPHPSN